MGLVALVLWNWRDRFRPGVLFAMYLVLAGIERFIVEFWRRNNHVAAGLTAAQLESLGLFIAGSIALALTVRRHGGLEREHAAPRVPSREPAAV
jgi:phosphatidylglycerol:prolipoprotein diacylglycerol transferase